MSLADTRISEPMTKTTGSFPARLKKLQNQHGKIWLNVGGGNFFLDDFVNVDSNFLCFLAPLYPAVKPLLKAPARAWLEMFKARRRSNNFIFANCRYPLNFPGNSVDHILISHFLEHLHYDHAVAVVKNYYSILKPGGTLHIIVPDLEYRAREYVSKIGDAAAAEAFVDWMAFHKRSMARLSVRILRVTGWFDLEHCFLYDLASLSKLVRGVGFAIAPQDDSPSASWRLNDPGQVNILAQKPAS
jgi:SAM-dependent methyltransferase